jgi:hypothetical protein
MNLLAWILCAAAWTGDGDGKEAAPRPPVRRQLPISAREGGKPRAPTTTSTSRWPRFQPWIEDQNIFSAMGQWDPQSLRHHFEAGATSPPA